LVAETGFEPVTFGNSTPVHLQCVSNIAEKPVFWVFIVKEISKAAHTLTSKCQLFIYKNLTLTAELLPSAGISKSISKKQEKSHNFLKIIAELLPSSQFEPRSII
jgi:hypothetical protein